MDLDGDRPPAERATALEGPVRPRRRRHWLRWTGLFVLLLVAFAGWVGFRTLQAYQGLSAARTTIRADLQLNVGDLTETDPATLSRAVTDVQTAAAKAHDAVTDPLFRVATGLPWIGADLDAVSTIATSVDGLARQVLPALVQLASAADPAALEPRDSSIDLAPILAAAPGLQRADTEVAGYASTMRNVDRDGLFGPVADAVGDLTRQLDSLQAVTSAGTRLTRLLPAMLGADSPRRYLVLFQNLAELRSTGGLFGSYAVLTADNGRVSVTGQAATQRTIPRFDTPVATLTPEELVLYGQNITTIPMDVNFTPDFPLAASLFTTMYQATIDPAPLDGVIAIDPVALAAILKGFEPVAVEGQALTSESLVKLLLSDAYAQFPDNDQTARDTFLANATATAFNEMTTTPRDVRAVIAGLRLSVEQRRLLIYSTHPEEQAELSAVRYTGELPAADPPDAPSFGIYMTDRTYQGSKLAYYLSGSIDLTADSCRPDGSRDVTASVRLTSDAPNSGLPLHVAGNGPKAYTLTDEIRVYAPTGGATVTGAEFDGTPLTLVTGTDLDRSVARFTVDLPPGSTSTVTVHFRLPPAPAVGDQAGMHQPEVLTQPYVTTWPVTEPAFARC